MPHRVDQPESFLRAAIARTDVTPPVGIYHRMWGAATHDRSTGVHRPLTATALAIAPIDGESHEQLKIAIALDHCLLWPMEMNQFLDRVSTAASVARENLHVFFSHTHGAGLMGLERCDLPGGELIAEYLETMANSVARIVSEARASLAPAVIQYAVGRCGLATNRDYFDEARGGYVCGFNPLKPVDTTVVVARIADESSKAIGTIVNYACHPTTLAWENTLISPDYVGAMREVIENTTDAPCFFIQGASGDVGPRRGFVGDTRVADRNGRQLSYSALSAMEALGPPQHRFEYTGAVVSGATIGTWKFAPIDTQRKLSTQLWRETTSEVELRLRKDLPNRDELLADRERWQAAEKAALDAGDTVKARDARAMVERATRRLTRVQHLPQTESLVYSARLWRIGDAVWIPLDGEHYNVLQTMLRDRFPQLTLIIGTLANGSTVWYLPDAGSYGKGLYQEEASVLAQGSLETLIESLATSIQKLID